MCELSKDGLKYTRKQGSIFSEFRELKKKNPAITIQTFDWGLPFSYCNGQWHFIFKDGYEYASPCPDYKTGRTQERVEKIVKKQDKEEKTFENFIGGEDIKIKIQQFSLNPQKKTLFLFGNTGVGKTHLAKALWRELLLKGKSAIFLKVEELNDIFRTEAAGDWSDRLKAKQRISEIKKADFLIIDDLGSERATGSELFDERLKYLLDIFSGKLMITTNLDSKAVHQKYGDKIYSRLMEKVVYLKLNFKDYRVKI